MAAAALLLVRLLLVAAPALSSGGGLHGDNRHAEVASLPGWEGPLPSRIWSGFGDAGPPPAAASSTHMRMHMHYLFVESEGDPEGDPVLVWYNGGPGASSLFGLLVELGPLLLNAESLAGPGAGPRVPRLVRNDHSWSRAANLLVVDSPPPVGFSFCEPAGPTGDGNSCGAWDDARVAKANHHFLTRLFEGALAGFAHLDVFLVGESYAGIYIPTIAKALMDDPRGVKLAGYAIGDGCLGLDVLCGTATEPIYEVEFFHGHGQVSELLHREIHSACSVDELRSLSQNRHCRDKLQEMRKQVGGYYSYGLYDECYWTPGDPFLFSAQHLGAASMGYPCPGPAFGLWLDLPEVRRALHVAEDSAFFSGDNGVGFDYTLSERDVRPIHLHTALNTSLRVLVYNGDTDPGINSFVTQDKFIRFWESHNVSLVSEWRPWTLDGGRQLVGYVMQYEGNWSFATIRGSGHMVPEYKPRTGLELISSFLEGRSLKPYQPKPHTNRVTSSPHGPKTQSLRARLSEL